MIDYVGGENEIRKFIYSHWVDRSEEIVSYVPEMRFQGIETNDPPGVPTFWARLSVVSLTDQQATLSTCSVVAYTRRYRDNGRVVVQLFGPRTGPDVSEKLKRLAELVQNRLRGGKTENGIWFRNARIDANLSPESLFQRINVVCEYERDEII
jgi:hypothetical protein